MMLLDLVRYAVFAIFVASAAVALGSWAARTRRIPPLSGAAQLIRRVTDPILDPIETWQLKRGGNPQHAPWWLLGAAVVGGILAITLVEFLAGVIGRLTGAAAAGPRAVVRLIVYFAGQVVLLALIIRVIASWFGAGRYNRWVGWTYPLTDWIVEPLRRIIPPIGMVDITPIVAWFLLQFVLAVIVGAI